MAVRLAMGANRSRMIRQMLTESVISVSGLRRCRCADRNGSFAVCAAVTRQNSPGWPRWQMDWTVLGFALFVSLLAGLGFGFGSGPAIFEGRNCGSNSGRSSRLGHQW